MAMQPEPETVQQAEVFINASPEDVYALISDVTRTGEWSPECRKCRWLSGARHAEVGAHFRGYNKYRWLRWSRLNEVIVAEPGREFAFRVLPDWMNKHSSIWRYRLQARDESTLVTESTQPLIWPGRFVRFLTSLVSRDEDMTENIQASLQRIKAIVESRGGQ